MVQVKSFAFNPFQENTYILYDETKECVVFDPGCSNEMERKMLDGFIEDQGLTLVKLVNTHCHIDHVLGNKHIAEKYGLKLESHKGEIPVLAANDMVAKMYGVPYEKSPDIEVFWDEGDVLKFGNTELKILFTPGHSPASISFYNEEAKIIIAGDVLFDGSIGRTDLPGGDFNTLISSIKDKLFGLGDDYVVYNGHGPCTTIGKERASNPFLV